MPDDVKKYIRYICDRRLISLGLKGHYKVKRNPLPWVEEMINAPTHTNFFENRATDYARVCKVNGMMCGVRLHK